MSDFHWLPFWERIELEEMVALPDWLGHKFCHSIKGVAQAIQFIRTKKKVSLLFSTTLHGFSCKKKYIYMA